MIAIQQATQNWFWTNAPAAWVSAAVAVTTCIVMIISRKRHQKLIIRQTRSVRLVRIWPAIRDKIAITFDGLPVDKLGQIEAEVFNCGSSVISNAEIKIGFPAKTQILGILAEPETDGISIITDNSLATISIPFMNSFKEHKQKLYLTVLIDGESEPISVFGSGIGWSTKYQPLPTRKQILRRQWLYNGLILLLTIVFYWYANFAEAHWGIPGTELSLRTLLHSLPFLTIFVALLYLIKRFVFDPLKARY